METSRGPMAVKRWVLGASVTGSKAQWESSSSLQKYLIKKFRYRSGSALRVTYVGGAVRFIRAAGNRSGMSCGLISAARFTVRRSTSSSVPPCVVFQVLTSAHV